MSSPSRTTRGTLPLVIRLFLWLIAIVVLFYLSWLGTSYVRDLLPGNLIASPKASAHVVSTTAVTTSAPTVASSSTSVPATNNSPATSFNSDPIFTKGNKVTIDGNVIAVAVSTTTAAIDQGLQNQPSLGASQGMLFLFKNAQIYRFWMPNMNFPLDMIWISSNMQVVDVTKDAPPLSDPTKPVWFTPRTPAEYVLEVNAGYADEHHIQVGDKVTFSLLP